MPDTNQQFIAHVKQTPDGEWAAPQSLIDHLINTAVLARDFANVFSSGALQYRLANASTSEIIAEIKKLVHDSQKLFPPSFKPIDVLEVSLRIRMMFSCLVYAASRGYMSQLTSKLLWLRSDL